MSSTRFQKKKFGVYPPEHKIKEKNHGASGEEHANGWKNMKKISIQARDPFNYQMTKINEKLQRRSNSRKGDSKGEDGDVPESLKHGWKGKERRFFFFFFFYLLLSVTYRKGFSN